MITCLNCGHQYHNLHSYPRIKGSYNKVLSCSKCTYRFDDSYVNEIMVWFNDLDGNGLSKSSKISHHNLEKECVSVYSDLEMV